MAALLAAMPFAWHQFQQLLDDDDPTGARIVSATVFRTGTQGGTYVFPDARDLTLAERRSAYAAEQSDSQETGDRWFRSRGGVDPHESNVQVVLQGLRQEPVRITNMVVDADCSAPLTGTLMYSPAAGSDDSIRIGVDLDSARQVPYALDGSGKKAPYFPGHTISLAEKEQVVLDILATTQRHYCAYTYRLKILTKDGEQNLVIDDHGKPFKVTAVPSKAVGEWKDTYPAFRRLYIGGVANPNGDVNPWPPKDPKAYVS
ncbi:hypothetical protein [Streptomyces prunicolor]|uniref:hypothetical protein n=1 Tax=Streptomyces prunicolor TaxID=67348 RepID=UPI00343D14A0